jgi:precorrin-2 dehydrogenase/sirohydrochlorin ferrochelatase
VRIISPEFVDSIPVQAERCQKRYDASDLRDAGLVFAATDNAAVNDAVVNDAKHLGILVNRADGSEESPGDFVTTAKLVKGSVMVTVSAGSAALSVRIRDGIDERFDPAWAEMADAMSKLRPMILADEPDAARRREMLRKLASDDAMKILHTQGIEALTKWLGYNPGNPSLGKNG